jgi:hypothetical protein
VRGDSGELPDLLERLGVLAPVSEFGLDPLPRQLACLSTGSRRARKFVSSSSTPYWRETSRLKSDSRSVVMLRLLLEAFCEAV